MPCRLGDFTAHIRKMPDGVDDVALEQGAAESGIRVKALSSYYLKKRVRRSLLVGYAYCTPEKIAHYGRLLARIIVDT